MGKEPRKVSKIEDGYVFSHRDDSLGRDIYIKKTEAPPAKKYTAAPRSMTGTKSVSTQTSSKPTVSKSPIKKISPPVNTEDLIYIDPPAPTVVQQPNMPLYEDKRIDRKLQPPINPNIDYYKLPDANAGYSQATDAYFDKATQRQIDPSKSFGPSGDYLPSYLENAVKANEGANLGTVKQGNPRVTTDPSQTYVMPGNENDKTGGMKGIAGVGTGGYKKGGLVGKLKSHYAVGGIVSQNDNQPKREEKTPERLAREEKLKSNVGAALGGAGSSYYNSQIPESDGDSARSGALAGVSQAGAIGGVIGGVASIGDRIGKPIKQKSEALNSDGTLKNDSRARRNAIIGGIAGPSKALATRSSYKGGYTDISGKGYTAYLEKQAQDQIKEVEKANLASQQQQGLVNRDNNNFDGVITTPYDLKNATFNSDKQLVLGDGTMYDPNRPTYRKGGLVGKMKQACATGGKIVGKGTSNSDSINATVKGDSYVVPAVNAPIAEEIRKKVLKAPVKKANLNQKSGEEVKLSNGEHLFTPEENEKLKQKGINLDVLAPNANETNSFDKGGKVKKDDKKEEAKSAISQVQRELGFNGDEELDYNKASGNKKTYKELITPPMSWKGSKEAWKAAVDRSIRSGKVKPADSKTSASRNVRPPSSKQKVTPETMESKNVALSTLKQDGELRSKKEVDNADMAINSTVTDKETKKSTPPKTKRTGSSLSMSNVDPTALVGIGQTLLGLKSLKGLNRPVDKPTIDPTYNESVNRAVNDARFGLTPEQKFAADQDIQNSLNDSRAAAVNYSGGNGVQAFNLSRSAINDAWRARLGLKTADTSLRMQKQQYADQQVAGRANVLAANRRRAYEDAMNTFQQKQQAGSELIGAGLANTVGAYRFNQDMKARKNADYERNRWTTDYGNTLSPTI